MNFAVPKSLSLIFSFVLILFLASLIFVRVSTKGPTVRIGGVTIAVTLAQTPQEQEQGLSGTAPLTPNTGMLFVFPKPARYSFWMKDMNYPIDIVWIGEDKKIVHFVANAKPESYPNTFTSEAEALYVLEVPSGFIQENHVSIGDKVELLITKKETALAESQRGFFLFLN
jgi:uncharacterized membrane protein (UPF0127 family)